jgi:methanogenic corrinoid protein MtbC1
VKTTGGHRRFLPEDVASFIRAQHKSPREETKFVKLPEQNIDDVQKAFFDSIIAGNESESSEILLRALLSGIAVSTILDQVVARSMHKIGDLWSQGELTIAQEHIATRMVSTAIEKFRASLPEPLPTQKRAICFSFEGDFHELSPRLAHVALESAGWDVRNLGASMPIYSLVEEVSKYKPRLICGSSQIMPDADRLRREFPQLLAIAKKQGSKIVFGGNAFSNPLLRERFPCDFFANSFEELLKFSGSVD